MGEISIRLGRRAKELRSPEERKGGCEPGGTPVAASSADVAVECPQCGRIKDISARTARRERDGADGASRAGLASRVPIRRN